MHLSFLNDIIRATTDYAKVYLQISVKEPCVLNSKFVYSRLLLKRLSLGRMS